MEEGVVLLSYRHLGSFRQKRSRKEEPRNNKRTIFQMKTLASLLNKLLPIRKPSMKKVESHKVFYSKKPETPKCNFVMENEIERFHRDFILPLENWEPYSDGKFSLPSQSDFDSGHFSEESGSLSSTVSTISEVTVSTCRWVNSFTYTVGYRLLQTPRCYHFLIEQSGVKKCLEQIFINCWCFKLLSIPLYQALQISNTRNPAVLDVWYVVVTVFIFPGQATPPPPVSALLLLMVSATTVTDSSPTSTDCSMLLPDCYKAYIVII